MAKKKKGQKEEVAGDAPPHPSSTPRQAIVIYFINGQPRLETNGDLQVWHFMTAEALLRQVTLQNVLLGILRRSKAVEEAAIDIVLPR